MRRTRRLGLGCAVMLLLISSIVTATGRAAAVTEYPTGASAQDALGGPVVASDGNIWAMEFGHDEGALRVTPSGVVTTFTTGLSANAVPTDLIAGPDGDLWFNDYTNDAIGQITTSGAITEFPAGTAGTHPTAVTEGSDGNLWFTYVRSDTFSRMTPSGSVTNFPEANMNAGPQIGPGVLAPDGNIWFVDDGTTPSIGKLTPSGTVTQYSAGLAAKAFPAGLIVGPDGNLWFVDAGCGARRGGTCAVGMITPSGTITEFTAGIPVGTVPNGIIDGPNGSLWFDGAGNSGASGGGTPMVGQVTTSGAITAYTQGLSANSDPIGMVAAADGNVWFIDSGTAVFGEVTPAGVITETSGGLPAGAAPLDLINGSDGDLWYVDEGNGSTTAPEFGRLAFQDPPTIGTATASGLGNNTATVTASVNPVGAPVSAVSIQYGTTTAYGMSAPASPGALPSSGTPTTVSAQLSGLPAGTTIDYRVVATNAYGTTDGPGGSFVTTGSPAPPTIGPSGPMVKITVFKESAKRWRAGPAKATIEPAIARAAGARARIVRARHGGVRIASVGHTARTAGPKVPVGTHFRFALTAAASVKLTFVAGPAHTPARCRRHAHAHGCPRTLGSLHFFGHAGTDTVTFAGRISRRVTLRPGAYTVRLTAGASSRSLRFTIVR